MPLGLVFLLIAAVWFFVRKPIAMYQAVILQRMLMLNGPLRAEQVRGLEMLGLFFCGVLSVGGLALVIMNAFMR
ncbi:hypothetical protein LFT45_17730 [Arthrobacter sp. FW305-BF8]|uniref:hypothetical protein n=1 Tax=Arthrobacter sp. FW305-BF8 TaxID=2879617 RepID=UPI001F3277CA|nr:hypothetical protein [Arthrobacter sp. FW305-BF8]UKA53537.1 hypothetical protein LFT45_17730 [Arthrobacter sp. FW305-BF8]